MNWYFTVLLPFPLLSLFSGTSRRTKFFGTFPGNYVKRLWITLPPIYAAFQHYNCVTLPERFPQASRCHALSFPMEVTHHHQLHLPPNHQQRSGRLRTLGRLADLLLCESAYSYFFCSKLKSLYVGIGKKVILLKNGWIFEAKMKVFHSVHFGSYPPLWQPENGLLLEAVVCIFTFLARQYIFLSWAAYCPDWRNMTTVLQLSFACTYML